MTAASGAVAVAPKEQQERVLPAAGPARVLATTAACSQDTKVDRRPWARSARQTSLGFPRFLRDRNEADCISEVRTGPRGRALARTGEAAVANFLELTARRHLLGHQGGLDPVKQALEPTDELGLGDP
jgi:hypothetical protein